MLPKGAETDDVALVDGDQRATKREWLVLVRSMNGELQ
jgi:hypothetical protein